MTAETFYPLFFLFIGVTAVVAFVAGFSSRRCCCHDNRHQVQPVPVAAVQASTEVLEETAALDDAAAAADVAPEQPATETVADDADVDERILQVAEQTMRGMAEMAGIKVGADDLGVSYQRPASRHPLYETAQPDGGPWRGRAPGARHGRPMPPSPPPGPPPPPVRDVWDVR